MSTYKGEYSTVKNYHGPGMKTGIYVAEPNMKATCNFMFDVCPPI